MDGPEAVKQIAEAVGGKIEEMGRLPDGSGYATISTPLPKDHWIYGDRSCERQVGDLMTCRYEPPPMPLRIGKADGVMMLIGPASELGGITVEKQLGPMSRNELAQMIRRVGKYAVRAATMKGADKDFDPDALLQNLVVGFLGYWTEDGLSSTDEWANPEVIP